ncbi:hypothetical protein KZ852_25115, partial [Pseudomonas aeruginosa]|nr:hypothetical protein [Pseudomonas aeruginosa]
LEIGKPLYGGIQSLRWFLVPLLPKPHAGICEKEIDALVADAYFFELDDVAAERALRQAINRQ